VYIKCVLKLREGKCLKMFQNKRGNVIGG